MKTGYIQFVCNLLSFPLRCHLSLYGCSTSKLVNKRKHCLFWNKQAYNDYLQKMVDIPVEVEIGTNVLFVHNAIGTVIHPYTKIGNNVKIYQGVTIGRGDIWEENSLLEGFVIKDNVVLCAGSKIICSEGTLTIGEGTIIGANSVLTCSTGDYEIWAGIPAKKIGMRKDITKKTVVRCQ